MSLVAAWTYPWNRKLSRDILKIEIKLQLGLYNSSLISKWTYCILQYSAPFSNISLFLGYDHNATSHFVRLLLKSFTYQSNIIYLYFPKLWFKQNCIGQYLNSFFFFFWLTVLIPFREIWAQLVRWDPTPPQGAKWGISNPGSLLLRVWRSTDWANWRP